MKRSIKAGEIPDSDMVILFQSFVNINIIFCRISDSFNNKIINRK